MKTRKRGRSPNQDCEECLPISKRITRLNIQSSSSVDESLSKNPSNYGNGSGQSSPEDGQLPWQQAGQATCSTSHRQGNNNNLNNLPCGSSQCDNIQNFTSKNSIHTYATHYGIPVADLAGYKPELKETENPHYFQVNSLLYHAHLEKAKRKGSGLDD